MSERGGLVGRVRRRFAEIRPAPTRATVDRRRVYGYGLIVVASLTALAWFNNSGGVAAAFLVALVLGMLWVAYAAHRAVVTTALAILWWIGTAPALGVISSAGRPIADLYFAVPQATATNVGLGVVVWLTAVLIRAPRPATTVMACWVLNLLVVLAASFVVPEQAWLAGYAVTLCVLAQRSGVLTRLRPGRVRRGEADPDDPGQVAVAEALRPLAASYGVRYGLPLGEDDHAGAVVVGPTGTYAVHGLVASGVVRTISGGTRIADGGRRLDVDVRAVAVMAGRAGSELGTPVNPVLVVAGGDFPDGLVRVAIKPAAGEQPVEVLVVRADLAAGRLAVGQAVLTTGQVGRILRRLNRIALTTVDNADAVLVP